MHLANVKTKVFGNHVDVFFGQEGWEPWARFKINKLKNGVFLEQQRGAKVPYPVMKHLINQFNGE